MLGKKIVVKYNNGSLVKGFTIDFNPDEDIFHLYVIDEETEEADEDKKIKININDIKAVFFVKSFKGNKDYKKVRTFNGYPAGALTERRIIVIFKDGENFYGTTHSYSAERQGFFVFPIDHQDNNDRVFVSKSALEKVHVNKFASEDFDIYLYEG